MISPKYIPRLESALKLITGPHTNLGVSPTLCIMQGEQILNNLRNLPQYSLILGDFLIKLVEGETNKTTNNWKIFILLQIQKGQMQIRKQMWWHLKQFYYLCSQKMQKIVSNIICKQLSIVGSTHQNVYREFINDVVQKKKWGISQVVKMLSLVNDVLAKIEDVQWSNQQSKKIKREHLQFLGSKMIQFLKEVLLEWTNFLENVIAQIVLIIKQFSQSFQKDMFIDFAKNLLQNVFYILKNFKKPNNTIMTLLYLSWNSFSQANNQFFHNFNIKSQMCQSLAHLLKYSLRKLHSNSLSLSLFTFYLTHFDSNYQLITQKAQQILSIYHSYIIYSEVNKIDEILPEDSDQKQQKPFNKYSIMSECLKIMKIQQKAIQKQSIQMFVCLAYANKKYIQVNQKMVCIIESFLNNISQNFQQQSTPIIMCCFRFLHLYVIENPNFNILQICKSLLILRNKVKNSAQICDSLLQEASQILITCTQIRLLWDFAQFWISKLYQNIMTVKTNSFNSILIIMESIQDFYYFNQKDGSEKVNLFFFFDNILQLMFDEILSIKDNSEPQVFKTFYKLASVLMKFVISINKQSLNEIELKKIESILQKTVTFLFRNQLYSPDLAFLYVQSLIYQNDRQGIQTFLSNLMAPNFWRTFDYQQVLFFSCVLIGLCYHFDSSFNFEIIYCNFLEIIKQMKNSRSFLDINIYELSHQLQNFVLLFGIKLSFRQITNKVFCEQQQIRSVY